MDSIGERRNQKAELGGTMTPCWLLLNADSPSITSDYSILQYANSMKNTDADTFEYMIDANERGNWGGIWSAPTWHTPLSATVTSQM